MSISNFRTSQNLLTQPLSWNDSFWDNVDNISQIDGAWDDEGKLDIDFFNSLNFS